MMTQIATGIHTDPARKHDFVLLFDVLDGNPNGDPDAGNLPRVDPETMQGLVTDVSLKRKVRDFVDVARGDGKYKIYVQHGAFLGDTRKRVFGEHGADPKATPKPDTARAWMCGEFFDVRMFGAVMSMKENNAGQVRGPLQMTFGRSIDPIVPSDIGIVGPAQNEKDVNKSDSDTEVRNFGTMGRKSLVHYGLYRAQGFWNPHFAEQTGADADDLALLWEALQLMWEQARSSSKGLLACRGLYVFSHESKLGNAPAHELFARIAVARKEGAVAPREFSHYVVTVNESALPDGVTLTRLVG